MYVILFVSVVATAIGAAVNAAVVKSQTYYPSTWSIRLYASKLLKYFVTLFAVLIEYETTKRKGKKPTIFRLFCTTKKEKKKVRKKRT